MKVPQIVLRAMVKPIIDIGQLSAADVRNLNKFVKSGVLAKGKGGPYPNLKTVYALVGHDFMSHRQEMVKDILQIHN